MHPDIAAFAQAHQLSDDATQALATLVGHLTTSPPTDDDGHTLFDLTGEPAAEPAPELVAGRYEDLGTLGVGGMGVVRRVHDRRLDRIVAMKVLHPNLLGRGSALKRFLDEGQATAQLQHPNIVPIHDMGTLPDGRAWFTMKPIEGRTLAAAIAEIHGISLHSWEAGSSGFSFKRLVGAFHRVCQAMAYAHERGVVHRDLKPENVMVGAHGQTYVLDWGLAKFVGQSPTADPAQEPLLSGRSGSLATRVGTVTGTPAYMSPEQARGAVDVIDSRSDVYALGAMLYEILAGRPPYTGEDSSAVIAKVLTLDPPPLAELTGPERPLELIAICERAMSRAPADRFPSALAVADEVAAWLEGARLREQARGITEQALARLAAADALRLRAQALHAEGEKKLEAIEKWRGEEDKAEAWSIQEEAVALRRQAELDRLDVEQGLHGALRVDPSLPEAHEALALAYRARHQRSEAERDEEDAAKAATLVRLHAEALPPDHPTRIATRAYLKGDGLLSLRTDPPGAQVLLHRYDVANRRLVEVPVGPLGATPLQDRPLPMGSYICLLMHPERELVRYPVEIPRQGNWSGVAPGESEPHPVWLPPRGWVGDDTCYVPAGWFRSGGDPAASHAHPARRLWCDGFVIQRFPVSNRDYLVFLDDLVAQGRTEEALQHAPRDRAAADRSIGGLIYGFDGTHFSLQPDADGDAWLPDYPVLHVDWYGARAYFAWLAARTGRPWRLPCELEWEKAARGVDGRWFPWGDTHDPSFACMADSHRTHKIPMVYDSFPIDCSPYGVRGMGGNVQDWCLDRFDQPDPEPESRVQIPSLASEERAIRVARGGSWFNDATLARVAYRIRSLSGRRYSGLGFRGVASVPSAPGPEPR